MNHPDRSHHSFGVTGHSAVRIRLTRLGIHCFLLASFAVFGGAVRNFNLLLVVSAIVFAALLIHWRWGRAGIGNLGVQRIVPATISAGQQIPVRLILTNHNRFLAAWMLHVSDKIEEVRSSATALGQTGLSCIAAGDSATAHYQCLIAQRGQYRFGPTTIDTTFPFSLFRCSVEVPTPAEFVVLPRLLKLRGNWHHEWTRRNAIAGDAHHRSGVNEGEFFGLRTWQYGDSPKQIHWRTTARTNEPTVRQFERQASSDLCIIVDAYATDASEAHDAETAISLAATLIDQGRQFGLNRIVLGVAGSESNSMSASSGTTSRLQLLELLAKAEISERSKLESTIEQVGQLAGFKHDCLVISPRSAASVRDGPTRLIDQFETFGGRIQWRSLRWIDVSAEIDQWVQG